MQYRIVKLPGVDELKEMEEGRMRFLLETVVQEWRASTVFNKLALEQVISIYESQLAILGRAYLWMNEEDAAIRQRLNENYPPLS